MLRFLYFFILYLLAISVFAENQPSPQINHVIYITLDGVRWQDIFLEHIYLPKLWDKYAKEGVFYGAPMSDTTMEVASIPISMPSYQSQMAGSVQACNGNDCGRIQVETFPENIMHKRGFNKKEVVLFSSWVKISLAVESIPKTTFTNTGNMPMYDPDTGMVDSVMYELNQKQAADHPHGLDRYDKYTAEQALHYFQIYQPRFMWISFTDADEAAHAGNLARYHQALLFYDDVLDRLFVLLKNLKLSESTLVIVTTDHGRGNNEHWTDHGPQFPESKQTWAFVMNGGLKANSTEGKISHYSTLSIRPTIESALIL